MCGIAGFFDPLMIGAGDLLKQYITAMTATLDHRGPDKTDIWVDESAGLALGHTHLRVVDMSQASSQPMMSSEKRWVIIYNGEIYNAPELRQTLDERGYHLRSSSDTEVVLEACAAFGVEDAVKRLWGMFAFALWDRHDRRLYLVRDRMGIKPLYWARFGHLILFGSELKALRAHPGWAAEIMPEATLAFAQYAYVPAPLTIYHGVYKLQPSMILTLGSGEKDVYQPYWSLDDVILNARANPLTLSEEEAVDSLDELMRDVLRRHMIADVPLGAFLSGGVDSSIVTAMMRSIHSGQLRTFSIGFDESSYNEAPAAQAIARYLETDHTELIVTAEDSRVIIPRLADIYDEPFGDSSQIPTYLLSELARGSITVALSGDGGDEVFAGYNRYRLALGLGRLAAFDPGFVRLGLVWALQALSPRAWDSCMSLFPWIRLPQLGDKAHKLAAILEQPPSRLYQSLVSHWDSPEIIFDSRSTYSSAWQNRTTVAAQLTDPILVMQYLDLVTYLPDDILTKVDRASMAVSLEARVPLLDHRLIELAACLPRRFKLKSGRGKWLLRKLLQRYVPPRLTERPKMGFALPIDSWLRGSLRDWAEDLLDEGRLRQGGIFNPLPIRQRWHEHLSGQRNWHHHIWIILMFQSWHARWIEKG